MGKYYKSIGILAVLFFLSACITLTEEEKKVRIATSPDIVKNCRFIDSFKIMTATMLPMGTQVGATPAYTLLFPIPMNKLSKLQKYKIKRTTLKMGGNTAFFDSNKKFKLVKKIKAYLCAQ